MTSLNLKNELIESGIIGSILKKPEMFYYADMVKPNMFLEMEYQGLFWAVQELIKDGVEELDEFTIITKLREKISVYEIYREEIESNNFIEILRKLKQLGTNDVKEFQRRVMSLITMDYKRNIPDKLRSIASKIENDESSGVNNLNHLLHSDMMKISEKYLSSTDLPLLGDIIDDIASQIKARATDDGAVGFKSKFNIINNYFQYEDGELIIIAGEKKSGKSVVLMNEAIHKAYNGVPTLILDTELSTRQYVERMLALLTGVTVRTIKSGKYTEEEAVKISEAKGYIKSMKLAHIYLPEKFPNWTFEDIFMITKSYQQKMGLRFMIFDYIKANRVSGINMQEHAYLGDLTEYLKNGIAGRLQIPILASAQMSPHEKKIADSDKINRYASVIAYWIKKSHEEVASDGRDAGTHKFFIHYNRLGRQFEEDEYINMYADLDIMLVRQAKRQDNMEGENPYD